MAYPQTFYAQTLTDQTIRPSLQGKHDTDTLIIGAGLAGLTTALHLARAGTNVTLIDAESVGFGASGRNGGVVSPGFACGSDAIAARTSPAHAQSLHALSVEGANLLRQTIQALAIQGADPIPGMLHLRRFDQGADLIAHAKDSTAQGYPIHYLTAPEIAERLNTTRYKHGTLDPQAFHIHPLNTLRAIAAEVERLGGHIFEHTPATRANLPSKTIHTPNGQIQARRLIFATGGYTGPLIPRLQRAILPIATYMMLTEPAPDLIATAIKTSAAVVDDRRAGDYYRLVQNGTRLLWGGRITTRAARTDQVARSLRAAMLDVYPQLAALKTDLAWTGQMAYARHLMPQLGQLQPDIWHITAFGGHGLNTTAIAGKVLAEAILHQSDRITLFAPFKLTWTGGTLGLIAAQLTYWRLQAQDLWRER
jgi:gamma-glutamylputrescine oxidase